MEFLLISCPIILIGFIVMFFIVAYHLIKLGINIILILISFIGAIILISFLPILALIFIMAVPVIFILKIII